MHPSLPAGSPHAAHWTLDPNVLFLNHGSFGACPRVVLDVQSEFRARMERQPMAFLVRDLERELDVAREALGALVGADPDDLAWVPNATTAVSTVLASIKLEPGDEVLTTDHDYAACHNALVRTVERAGARLVVARVPFPVADGAAIRSAVVSCATSRTRLAMIDHVTSATGVVFPIRDIVGDLSARGIATLIDGAHAPGMVALDLRALGATYYTGNLHKWLCTPKGCAFLYVTREAQRSVHPLTTSHGAYSPRSDRSRFRLEFDWTGTQDPSPWLCIPASIRFLASLHPEGLAGLMARNRQLALTARAILCAALGVPEPTSAELIGALAAVPLRDASETPRPGYPYVLQTRLLERGFEVPIVPWPRAPARLVRVSAQAYNSEAQYEGLARTLIELLATEA